MKQICKEPCNINLHSWLLRFFTLPPSSPRSPFWYVCQWPGKNHMCPLVLTTLLLCSSHTVASGTHSHNINLNLSNTSTVPPTPLPLVFTIPPPPSFVLPCRHQCISFLPSVQSSHFLRPNEKVVCPGEGMGVSYARVHAMPNSLCAPRSDGATGACSSVTV